MQCCLPTKLYSDEHLHQIRLKWCKFFLGSLLNEALQTEIITIHVCGLLVLGCIVSGLLEQVGLGFTGFFAGLC